MDTTKIDTETKGLESAALLYVTIMAQHSLDPDLYEKFCEIHDRLVEIRGLANEKLA